MSRPYLGPCVIEGCPGRPTARKLCKKHYQAWRIANQPPCTTDGCGLRSYALGLCSTHYRIHKMQTAETCTFEGCDRPISTGGLCNAHYQRRLKGREMAVPIRPYAPGEWGKWVRNGQGYVGRERQGENGREYQLQHAVVMEEQSGRRLRPEENVHHKNGVRDDNRLENLELWSKAQPPGQRIADKLAWAYEIIVLYGEAA